MESIRPQKQGSRGECFELLTADCTACLIDLILLTVSLRAGDHNKRLCFAKQKSKLEDMITTSKAPGSPQELEGHRRSIVS